MLGMVGTSYRRASLLFCETVARLFSEVMPPFPSVILITCNRAEWYFSSEDPAAAHAYITEYLRLKIGSPSTCCLFAFFGAECLHHLSRVVCGFDSVFQGESEIQGQVRDAYERAKVQNLSHELHFAFQRALHVGKVMRRQLLPLKENLGTQVVASVSHFPLSRPSVLCVGASTINKEIAKSLSAASFDVTIANRTNSRAEEFAQSIGATVLPWEDLHRWTTFPCVICAARSPYYVLPLVPHDKAQLLVDLGLPRNVDPQLSSQGCTVLHIDSFKPLYHQQFDQVEAELIGRTKKEYASLCRRFGVA